MTHIQTIKHDEDCVPLYSPHSLYLKPLAKIAITVDLPRYKTGKSISNLLIMEELSKALKPYKFFMLKASKNTDSKIEFEAEIEQRSQLKDAIKKLNGKLLKISGFADFFDVSAVEDKGDFPTRHDWDSFFRDASHMNEMKAGERPDTIHLTHLPIRWFCPRHLENDENVKPSESIFRRIFEKFGCVRFVDIPICDPYRSKMNSEINGMKTFSFEQDVLFEAYVQFDEYVGFTRAMDEFRGMKLVRKYVDKTMAINITVDFDKTKHLSDAQIRRRERVRDRLIAKAQAEEEDKEREKRLEEEKLEKKRQLEEQEKLAELERQREREEKRKLKHLKKIQEKGQIEISQEIRIEERKLMIAQRKLESIRVLELLFDRMRVKHIEKHKNRRNDGELAREKARVCLVQKYKAATENLVHEQREKVKDIKSKTPLLGLLSRKSKKQNTASSDDDEKSALTKRARTTAASAPEKPENAIDNAVGVAGVANPSHINPFKAVAALAAASGASTYPNEAASEWMKSLTMLPYVSSMFSHPLYRAQAPGTFPVSVNYRGYAPRIRGRGRGRGRGARGGGYTNYYNTHKGYKYGEEGYEDEGASDSEHHRNSYSRSRHYTRRSYSRHRSSSRSRSRNRSRSRRSHSRRSSSRSRSRSRTRRSHSRRRRSYSRSYTKSRSRSVSRGRSHSRQRSHTSAGKSAPPQRQNKKLVSTRRSRSTESDFSGYRSRSHSRPRSHHRSSGGGGGNNTGGVVIETENLVRSAEEIKRTIEKTTQEQMKEDEREIKETFRTRVKNDSTQVFGDGDSGGTGVNSTAQSPNELSAKETENYS